MVKKSAKTPAKKQRKLLHSRMQVFLSIVVVGVALIVGIIYAKAFFVQQQTLRDLDAAGKDLRVVYDNLLEANKGNVANSSFSKACAESSVKYGRGEVTCWVGGNITLNEPIELVSAQKKLNETRAHNTADALVYNSEFTKAVTIDYGKRINDIVCDGHYGQITISKQWFFNLSCRKTVPDFLPGYNIQN